MLETNVAVTLWQPKFTDEPVAKPTPVMVMIVPRTPDAGESFVITGLTATLSVELWNPVAAAVTVALPPSLPVTENEGEDV